MARWLVELQQYAFRVIHKPGRSDLNADALSRSNHLPAPSQEEEDEQRMASGIFQGKGITSSKGRSRSEVSSWMSQSREDTTQEGD